MTRDGNPCHPLYMKSGEKYEWFAVADYSAHWRYALTLCECPYSPLTSTNTIYYNHHTGSSVQEETVYGKKDITGTDDQE